MNEILIAILHLIFAFIITLFLTKWWINLSKKNKQMLVPDMNKYKKPLIPKTGGIAFVMAIILTVLLYIFFKTFILETTTHLIEIFVLIVTVLLACFIGFIDDIFGWRKSLKGWHKILMTIPIAIPLMVINAGHSIMSVPFIGPVEFGIIYPLVIVLFGIVGATNGYNLLAGYNGLETGLGMVIFSTLGIIAFLSGQVWLALIAGIIVISLLAFLIFNQYPAKIFPGNSLTYSLGALIAVFAILGNMERAAFLLFIPFIIEGFLKVRSKFKADNFGKPNKDNSLEPPYKKTYSLTHCMLKFLKRTKGKVYERDITNNLILAEIILAILVLIYVFIL